MSTWLGDFRTGKVVRTMWNSTAVAGESITRATNGTISVYKDANTTQSTTGVTDSEDFDSLTGVHHIAVDTSADGTFYSAGSDFMIVLSAATIDGKTINAVLAQFSLENRSALMPTTDGRKLDVSTGGEAGVDWANVGSPTTTLNLSGTTVKTATDVETDTQDIQSRLPAALGANGSLKADLRDSLGTAVTNEDGTLASATASTVTFPTTDSAGVSIPNDSRYQWCDLQIVGGTGKGQIVKLTTATGTARQYNVLSGTMPVQPDSTSRYFVSGNWKANVSHISDDSGAADNLEAALDGTGYTFQNCVMPAVTSVATVDLVNTLTTYTGNTVQTGDAFARLGAAGAGLTALGDTRLANLDATVSSRLTSASYTSPPSAATISTQVWAEAIESGLTALQSQRIIVAACGGTSTGMVAGSAGSPVFKNAGGSITRISATLDANGNRTAVTLSP